MDIELTKLTGTFKLLVLAVCSAATFYTPNIFATNPQLKTDLIMVIDSSKSMAVSDPMENRKAAAKLMLALLAPEDRAAIISFSVDGYALSELTQLDTQQKKQQLFDAIDKLSSKGNYTNFDGALNSARKLLTDYGSPDRQAIIVFLTDGKMALDTPENTQTVSHKLKTETIPWFAENNTIIHTIALTENADKLLLQYMTLRTGGQLFYSNTSDELHNFFMRITGLVKNRFSVSIINDSFKVTDKYKNIRIYHSADNSSSEFTLLTPGGERLNRQKKLPDSEWLQSPHFDLIALNKWESGEWKILNNNHSTVIFTDTENELDSRIMQQLDKTAGLTAQDPALSQQAGSIEQSNLNSGTGNNKPTVIKNDVPAQLEELEVIEFNFALIKSITENPKYKLEIRAALEVFLLTNAALILLLIAVFLINRIRSRRRDIPLADTDFNKPVILQDIAKSNNRAA